MKFLKNPSIAQGVGNPLSNPNTQPVKEYSSAVRYHHDQICDKPEGRFQPTRPKRLPVQRKEKCSKETGESVLAEKFLM
jgi:hypothetical protein